MPKFLEKKLKEQYGAKSSIPYAIMNKMGLMHGSKITAKGREAEKKHEGKMARKRSRKRTGPLASKSEAMGRGARRGFARAMRVSRQRLRGLGGETSAPPRRKRGKGTSSFAAILNRTRQ